MFRLIAGHYAGLRELEEYYSLDDLADLNDAVDAVLDAQQQMQQSPGGRHDRP